MRIAIILFVIATPAEPDVVRHGSEYFLILEINKQPVKGSEDAVRLTEKPKDKTTLLRVWSGGHSRFLVVDESNAG